MNKNDEYLLLSWRGLSFRRRLDQSIHFLKWFLYETNNIRTINQRNISWNMVQSFSSLFQYKNILFLGIIIFCFNLYNVRHRLWVNRDHSLNVHFEWMVVASCSNILRQILHLYLQHLLSLRDFRHKHKSVCGLY